MDNNGQVSVAANADGSFRIDNVTAGNGISVTADAPAYLPAVCTGLTVYQETNLGSITLLSGDLNDDEKVNILDLSMVGGNFGQTGSPADVNQDGLVDISDFILVSKNFGKETQTWSCPAL